ncbi:aminotransferase class I/II-fold pyridoxal phosphate-dependent enzyme [Rhodobacterales bacterium HKCCE2091]|nr:aminotransferase class I/II-fold pyridoxal phosphate-dependent enzyme [Rhodobacterales bacterium HKCCE2091]
MSAIDLETLPGAGGDLAARHYDRGAPDLLDRWTPVADWVWAQSAAGLLLEPRIAGGAPGPRAAGRDAGGQELAGADFARRDHLNLSSHEQVIAAAKEALLRYGPQAAGPGAATGLTALTLALETRIAEYLSLSQAVVFPDGWSAAVASMRALLRRGDRVLMARSAPAGFSDGAVLARAAAVRLDAMTPEAVGAALDAQRARAPGAGLLVAVEAADDGTGVETDLAALQAVCNRHRATLMADVTRDLGLLGASGRGLAEAQSMLGAVDVMTGSLAPVFAASAGFAASGHGAFKDALRQGGGPQAAAPSPSPAAAAAALTAFDLAEAEDGLTARTQVLGNANWLGAALTARGFDVLPRPGASVAVRIGPLGLARRMTAAMQETGIVVHLAESACGCEWEFHCMSAHGPRDLSAAAARAVAARGRAGDPAWQPPRLCEA